MTKTIIGLDCGATHSSLCVWVEEKKVLERHDLPGSNLDLARLKETGDGLVLEFEKLAEYKGAVWIVGMAGLDDRREVAEAEKWLRGILEVSLPFSGLTVMSDVDLVLWSGSPLGTGIGLIAGTGSNCFGRDNTGVTKKVGGLSHVLSDEGGGFMLGWRCLHLITGMLDGREERSKLADEVLELYGFGRLIDLKNFLVVTPDLKKEVARCAPLLLRASSRGEDAAGRAVAEESAELVRMVATANLAFEDIQEVYLSGSIFKDNDYRDQFIVSLHKYFPVQKIRMVTAIDGALSYARKYDL